MLKDKVLRKCPGEYWDLENYKKVMRIQPLCEQDICEIFDAGHRPEYKYNKVDKGFCCFWLNKIAIQKCAPPEEMQILIHELLHLVFRFDPLIPIAPEYLTVNGLNGQKCGALRRNIEDKLEKIIDAEEQRIYNQNPQLVLKIQQIFNFPEGEVY